MSDENPGLDGVEVTRVVLGDAGPEILSGSSFEISGSSSVISGGMSAEIPITPSMRTRCGPKNRGKGRLQIAAAVSSASQSGGPVWCALNRRRTRRGADSRMGRSAAGLLPGDGSAGVRALGGGLEDALLDIDPPERRFDCQYYDSCLTVAATLNWESFTCAGCPGEMDEHLLWRSRGELRRRHELEIFAAAGEETLSELFVETADLRR